jgi:hypothetical protein
MISPPPLSLPPELVDLKVYFGDANPAEARVYVQLPAGANRTDYRLTGKVSGPYCVYAHTLAATIPLRSLGPRSVAGAGDSLLAEAILPDPCFWSSELPFLYRVQVELQERGRVVATAEIALGIPALGSRGRDLVWQGKRWVLRGICREHVPSSSLQLWRESDVVLDIDDPQDALCAEASRTGAALVARLSGDSDQLATRLHELGRYPAVILAILRCNGPIDAKIRQGAPNLMLGELFEAGQPVEPSPWADVAICAGKDAHNLAQRTAACSIPVIAQRFASGLRDLAEGRSACDRLQADLASAAAAGTSFAGYIV